MMTLKNLITDDSKSNDYHHSVDSVDSHDSDNSDSSDDFYDNEYYLFWH